MLTCITIQYHIQTINEALNPIDIETGVFWYSLVDTMDDVNLYIGHQ